MGWLFGNGVKKRWLDVRLARLKQKTDSPLIAQLRTYLLNAPLAELSRINLVTLSRELNVPRSQLIPLFLQGTKLNLFEMHYGMQCGKCKGKGTMKQLCDIKHEMVCPACKYKNKPTLDDNMEIIFNIHPDLANVRANLSPSTNEFLSAFEVMNTEEFRTLFEAERPVPGEYLTVNNATFFFTDLSGSTATYEKLGDDGAYRIVREHFLLLFDIIKKHNGTVVKTIGDAVMATFLRPADAVAASLDIREAFKKFNKRKDIKGAASLKVGIHHGKCIAVTLNQRLDFFGTTVNKAARIQGIADKDEICVSKEVLKYPEAEQLLTGVSRSPRQVFVKGLKKPVEVTTLR